MVSTFLSRKSALRCPIHQAVKEEAVKRLEATGAFSKQEVLGHLSYEAMADSVRWEYVREFIEDDQGCELIPLSELYFRPDRSADRKANPMDKKPEKYLASGHGKRTAGYGSVRSDENSQLVFCRLKQRQSQASGSVKATERMKRKALENGSDSLKTLLIEDDQQRQIAAAL